MRTNWAVLVLLCGLLAGCTPRAESLHAVAIIDLDLLDLLYPPMTVPGWITHPRTRRQWLEEPWNRPWLWHQHHCSTDVLLQGG